jgi:hypothetical protein
MKSFVSYFAPMQLLPTNIYDIGVKNQDIWAPLKEIIIHKYVQGLPSEKKIEVQASPTKTTQDECFRFRVVRCD